MARPLYPFWSMMQCPTKIKVLILIKFRLRFHNLTAANKSISGLKGLYSDRVGEWNGGHKNRPERKLGSGSSGILFSRIVILFMIHHVSNNFDFGSILRMPWAGANHAAHHTVAISAPWGIGVIGQHQFITTFFARRTFLMLSRLLFVAAFPLFQFAWVQIAFFLVVAYQIDSSSGRCGSSRFAAASSGWFFDIVDVGDGLGGLVLLPAKRGSAMIELSESTKKIFLAQL